MKRSSLLPLYARPSNTFIKGIGCHLIDSSGKKFLDFTAGIAVNALGHNHPQIVSIIANQAEKLIHLSNLYHNEYAEGFADLMLDDIRQTDKHLQQSQIFFCNSGTEANEGMTN
jgi:acetylornithine aminotransferase